MKIIVPLPAYGFDPTEAAIPWEYLSENNVEVTFATPNGKAASADERLLTGKGFGPFKRILMADEQARKAYKKMSASKAFNHPINYSKINPSMYGGILLPGGHDKGMREYLESPVLQEKVLEFYQSEKLIGAICHGTIVAARTMDPETKHSILYNFQTTGLLRVQEMGAYYLTKFWLGDYYRTYKQTVEGELKEVLETTEQFQSGPSFFHRDSKEMPDGFVVEDHQYLSARWPGDAHAFAKKMLRKLKEEEGRTTNYL